MNRKTTACMSQDAGAVNIRLHRKSTDHPDRQLNFGARTLALAATVVASTASLVATGDASASCGSAYCTVNSDWTSQTAITETGMILDLRYEMINQNRPRAGTHDVPVGALSRHHDEVSTMNRNLVLSMSLSIDEHWGVSLTAPLVDRDHLHIHNHRGEQLPERWSFRGIGDVKLLGRYQVQTPDPMRPGAAGFTFGFKLPTGKTDVANGAGAVAERTLQPGTGTTDVVVGAYYHQHIPESNGAWFTQVQYQRALNSHADYKPGDRFGIDAGYRQRIGEKLGLMLQLNATWRGRDSGADAEPDDSGLRNISVAPGFSYALTDTLQAYGFIQKPLWQDVNGVQLTARTAYVIGLSGRF